jgi:hypothetical protein
MPSYVQLQTQGVRTLFIPAADPDGAVVSCRFATPAESGLEASPPAIVGTGNAPTLAPNANPPGCMLTWNLAGARARAAEWAAQAVAWAGRAVPQEWAAQAAPREWAAAQTRAARGAAPEVDRAARAVPGRTATAKRRCKASS